MFHLRAASLCSLLFLASAMPACDLSDAGTDGADAALVVLDDGKEDGVCPSGPALGDDALALWSMSQGDLEELWKASPAPSDDALRNSFYLGINQGALHEWMADLGFGFQRFIKAFYDSRSGELSGHNFVVPQGGHAGPYCLLRTSPGVYRMQGYFEVDGPGQHPDWRHHSGAALLDYGKRARLNTLDPSGLLRDYLVQPFASPDILIGRAYLDLPFQPTVGFFILQRVGSLDSVRARGWTPPQ